MKKRFLQLGILMTLFLVLTTGCFNDDKLEGSTITTTVYPIEYLTDVLYGYNSTIKSIYPPDTNIETYELTEKQIKEYSKNANVFIYNGLSDEKEIAKNFINKNNKLQIIDVSYGLKYNYGVEELWLSPNNYLMLANTIKNDLKDLSSSKYAAQKIEENYSELEENLSLLDAELRNIAKAAEKNGTNTIVIAYDTFGFLNEYGFEIINITNESNITSSIKNKFKTKEYNYIFVKNSKKVSNSVKDLVDNYGATLIEINTMETLTEKEKQNNDNYLTITRDFFNNLSKVVTK